MFDELDAIVAEIEGADDPHVAAHAWGKAQKMLLRSKADKRHLAQIIMGRDIGELKRLLSHLRSGGAGKPPAEAVKTAPAADIDPATLRAAMRAFRKRLKLTRLDDESRINVSPITSGRRSQIDAILPPHEFASEVWAELVRQGELRDAGQGFYELAEEG